MTYNSLYKGDFPVAGLLEDMAGGLTPTQRLLYTQLPGGELDLIKETYASWDVVPVGAFTVNLPEVFLSSTKPITNLSDLRKLKVRSTGDSLEIINRMGAPGVFLPGGEVYEALERGVVDAVDWNNVYKNELMGFQEVVDYMYISPCRSPGSAEPAFVNKARWSELPSDLQEIVLKVVRGRPVAHLTFLVTQEAAAIERVRSVGVQVVPLPKDVEDECFRVADEMYAERDATDPLHAKIRKAQVDFKKMCEDRPTPCQDKKGPG
jgi:TRAP-type mannitol/chloroaromatic compound transport system substrate-binding protein